MAEKNSDANDELSTVVTNINNNSNMEPTESSPRQEFPPGCSTDGDCIPCVCDEQLVKAGRPSNEESLEFNDAIRLDELLPELMVHICSFLEARFVVGVMTQVCRRFHQLFSNTGFWKARVRKQWPLRYPAISMDDEVFSWPAACVHSEEQYRLWSNPLHTVDNFRLTDGGLVEGDALQLMQNGRLLAVGSRDRALTLLDLTKLVPGDPRPFNTCCLFSKHNAHKGWIWSMSAVDDEGQLVTGSWDTYVKLWDMSTQQPLHSLKTTSAILCTHYTRDGQCVIAGSYNRRVYHMDLRVGAIQSERIYHKGPVLCVVGSNAYLITASEDSTVCVYDRRADRLLDSKLKLESYVMSMSYDGAQLWLGDKSGLVHLVDASTGILKLVDTYDVGHKGKITGMVHTLGAMFTCSTNLDYAVIKVHEPSRNPGIITSLPLHGDSVSRISVEGSVVAYSGLGIGVYRPKTA